MGLTPLEIERYKRHLVLREVGGQGQQKLKAARVLAVGAGGLCSPLLMYLAAAGVGTIGVVDDDRVSLDNLQRQIVHATPQVGVAKVASAAETIARLNPHVQVEAHDQRLDAANALALISRYDIVADGSDNFATRYLVSDACYLARKPLVFAAVGPFDGYLTTFKPYEKVPDGEPYPTYRCVFPEPPPPGTVANCAEVGVRAPPSAWSAPCRRSRFSRSSWGSARASPAASSSTMRRPPASPTSSWPGTRPIRSPAATPASAISPSMPARRTAQPA